MRRHEATPAMSEVARSEHPAIAYAPGGYHSTWSFQLRQKSQMYRKTPFFAERPRGTEYFEGKGFRVV